jgi:hypothetical protein
MQEGLRTLHRRLLDDGFSMVTTFIGSVEVSLKDRNLIILMV